MGYSFKHTTLFDRQSVKLFKRGVILVYLLVLATMRAALFWTYCNFPRSDFERLLKSELQ